MCILFLFTDPNPKPDAYRLIIASNRDEFLKRPTKHAFECPETGIIGGRDMEPGREGGMWLGISVKDGKLRFGALLNVRGGQQIVGGQGRGPIVYNYLNNGLSLPLYLDSLKTSTPFSAFNFVAVELNKGGVVTSHFSNAPDAHTMYEGLQLLGFGNSTIEEPLQKVKFGKEKFQETVKTAKSKEQLVDALLKLLKDGTRHLPDPELQKRVPKEFEGLSSICVNMEEVGYGTRTHSIVLVDYDWNVEFIEHTIVDHANMKEPKWQINVIKAHL